MTCCKLSAGIQSFSNNCAPCQGLNPAKRRLLHAIGFAICPGSRAQNHTLSASADSLYREVGFAVAKPGAGDGASRSCQVAELHLAELVCAAEAPVSRLLSNSLESTTGLRCFPRRTVSEGRCTEDQIYLVYLLSLMPLRLI